MKIHRIAAAAAAVASCLSAQTLYTVVDLGSFPGFASSKPAAINDFGDVVGTCSASLSHRAFLYTDAAGLVDPGLPPGVSRSFGMAINNSGQIAVQTSFGAFSGIAGHAWRLTPGTGWQDLGHLGGGSSDPTFMNSAGDVVGVANLTSAGAYEPFVFRDGAGMVRLSPGSPGRAVAINDLGQVAGYSNSILRFVPGIGMQNLGSPPLLPNVIAGAMDSAGNMVGVASTSNGHVRHLWHYSDALGLRDLGWTGKRTVLRGMNNHGVVVGKYDDDNGTAYALVQFDEAVGPLRLDLFAPAGWSLFDAFGINDGGQIIAFGRLNGGPNRAVRLDPVFVASSQPVGNGCSGIPGTWPQLSATRPVLGSTFAMAIGTAANNSFGVVMFASGAPSPVPLGLGQGCTTYPNLSSVIGQLSIATDATGAGTTGFSLPNTWQLAGMRVTTQAAVLSPTSSSFLDFSQGIDLLLGF